MTNPKLQKGEAVPNTVRQWFVNDRDHTEKWRAEAKEDYDFVAGRQWSEDEIAALKEKARPIIAFNRIGPIVDVVAGHEVGNRREVRYIPREMGDVKPNELLTSAAEWFRDQAHADDHESDAFVDAVICGMGWTESRIDYEDSPDGQPKIERLDPLEMYWDFEATHRNLAGARRVWRVRRMPLSEAENLFPGFNKHELDAQWTLATELAEKVDHTGPDETSGDGLVTIVHAQWVEREPYYLAEDPMTGQQVEFSVEEFGTANKRLKQMAGMEMQGVRLKRKVRKQAFLGNVVLSVGAAPSNTDFSLQCITVKRDRNKGTWYGLVRAMKDPQRWANKWLSQMLHIMNSNSKGGLLAEKGAFEDIRQAEESWAQSDEITWVTNGAMSEGRIQPKAPAQFPVGFQQLTEFAISSIRDVSGVSVELLGMREANQAASLELQRRQSGMTILQPVFDALKHYRERQGRVMLDYIQNDLSDGRLIRIVGKEQERYVPLIRQAAHEFDIIVDDAPSSPNQKELVWGIMAQLMPMLGPALPPQMIVKALKYSPLPSSVVEEIEGEMRRVEEMQAQGAQAEQQMAQQAMQLEMQGQAAKAAADQAKAQGQQIKNRLDAAKMGLDRSRLQIEAGRAAADIDLGYIDADNRATETRIKAMQAVTGLLSAERQGSEAA